MRKFHLILMVSSFSLFWGCTPDEPEFRQFNKSTGVYILNEGNFTYGNASLSFLDLETNEMDNEVFFKANAFPLGDVAYSMTIQDTTGYICVNNSGKIFAIHTATFKHQGTISGLVSPRFMAVISPNKAYVTDLYATHMAVVNPQTLQITDSIAIGHSTEQILLWNDYAFVTCWSFGNKVVKIDTRINQPVEEQEVNKQPNSLVMDQNEILWILSDGGYTGAPGGTDYPALTKINPSDMSVLSVMEFPDKESSPSNLLVNGAADSLYFLYGSWAGETKKASGIYKMSVTASSLPENVFIPEESHRFYRIGVDPVKSDLYVSDAKDYLQKGWIFRFDSQGILIDSLEADRIPGFFAFRTE